MRLVAPHEVIRFTTYVTAQLRLDALPSPRLSGRGGLLHTVCRAVHKMKDYCWMTCVFGFVRRLPLPPLQHLHNNLFKTLSTMSRCRSALQTLAGMNASSMVTAIVDYQHIYAKSATRVYISWCWCSFMGQIYIYRGVCVYVWMIFGWYNYSLFIFISELGPINIIVIPFIRRMDISPLISL